MSLNLEAIDDLDADTIVDNEVIQGPSELNPNQKPVTLIADAPALGLEPTELTDDVLSKLPEADLSFQFIEDGVSKVASLGDIEAEIIGAEAISIKEAEVIHSAFGSLVTESMPLATFTKSATKVNYAYSLRYMRTEIAREEASVVEKFEAFTADMLKDAIKGIDRLVNRYIPDITDASNEVTELIKKNKEAVTTNKNAVVTITGADGTTFLNVLTCNLKDNTLPAREDWAPYTAAANGISLALKNPYLLALILGDCDGATSEEVFSPGWASMYSNVPVSMNNLAQFYLDSITYEVLESITSRAKAKLESLLEILKTDKKDWAYTDVSAFVSANEEAIHSALKYCKETAELFYHFSVLNRNVLALIPLYESLQ